MNKTIMTLLITSLLTPSVFSANLKYQQLTCPAFFSGMKGVHGKFIRVINRADWTLTNYIFENDFGEQGCVQMPATSNADLIKIAYNAFILQQSIYLATDSNYTIEAIDASND